MGTMKKFFISLLAVLTIGVGAVVFSACNGGNANENGVSSNASEEVSEEVSDDSSVAMENACEHAVHNTKGQCVECKENVGHTWTALDDTYSCTVCEIRCEHNRHRPDLTCIICGNEIVGETHTYGENSYCTECHLLCMHEDYDGEKCNICGQPCRHERHDTYTLICCVCGKQTNHTWMPIENSAYGCVCGAICEHEYHHASGECLLCGAIVEHEYDFENIILRGDNKFVECVICERQDLLERVCIHAHHHQDSKCCYCGADVEHTYDYDNVKECGDKRYVYCIICGKEGNIDEVCTHTYHDMESQCCLACGKYVGHTWTPVEDDWLYNGGVAYECCGCDLMCCHDVHSQDGECLLCGAIVEHSYDLLNIVELAGRKFVYCVICDREEELKNICPHNDSHDQTGACYVCGVEGVAIHFDNDFDDYCDVCDLKGVGAWLKESCEINEIKNATSINNVASDSLWAVKVDGKEVEVTIVGGEYHGGTGNAYNIPIWANNGATVVIEDGLFTVGKDKNGDVNSAIYASKGSKIEIKGGTFKTSDDMDIGYLINCQNNSGSTIIIKGGTFYNFNPMDNVAAGAGTSFLAAGYTVEVTVVGNDTIYTVVPEI